MNKIFVENAFYLQKTRRCLATATWRSSRPPLSGSGERRTEPEPWTGSTPWRSRRSVWTTSPCSPPWALSPYQCWDFSYSYSCSCSTSSLPPLTSWTTSRTSRPHPGDEYSETWWRNRYRTYPENMKKPDIKSLDDKTSTQSRHC